MSEENAEIVRRVYDGWSRGDFSQTELFDPDIEFEMIDWPHPAKSRGIEAMSRAWLTTLSAWDDFRASPDELVVHGDKVLVGLEVADGGEQLRRGLHDLGADAVAGEQNDSRGHGGGS